MWELLSICKHISDPLFSEYGISNTMDLQVLAMRGALFWIVGKFDIES